MTTTPTGNISLTLANLETMIASSETFRTACEAADVDSAKKFIYWPETDPESEADRAEKTFVLVEDRWSFPDCYAIIRLGDGFTERSEDSGGDGFMPEIPLEFLLVKNTNPDVSARERQIVFENFAHAVIADIKALAKTEGYLWITQIAVKSIVMSDPEEADSYAEAAVEVRVW